MRFISPSSKYRYVVIHDETSVDPSGYVRTVKPGYTCQWQMGLLTPYEKQLAREKLVFRGVPMNMDGTPYDPVNRASVFDTADIEDQALRHRVEKILLVNQGNDSYILVEAPKVPAPWPTYDQLTVMGNRTAIKVAKQNLEVAAVTGVDIRQLIDYEKQNRNDERILAEYEKALEAPSEPVEDLVEA